MQRIKELVLLMDVPFERHFLELLEFSHKNKRHFFWNPDIKLDNMTFFKENFDVEMWHFLPVLNLTLGQMRS